MTSGRLRLYFADFFGNLIPSKSAGEEVLERDNIPHDIAAEARKDHAERPKHCEKVSKDRAAEVRRIAREVLDERYERARTEWELQ